MKYGEFIEKFNQLYNSKGSEADRYYAKEDQGNVNIFCRDYVIAKLIFYKKYWEFSKYSAYSAFDSERLKLMAELAETEPKFRDDTLWVLLNGRPRTIGGIPIYNYFKADNDACHLEADREFTYKAFEEQGAYTSEELAKLKAELKEKGELGLLGAVESLAVKLNEVENIDENH